MISEVGYGAWGIGGNQWRGASDDESLASLRTAVELGLDFIDTALAYGDGHSERLIGRFLKETHTPIRVATKIPPKNLLWPARSGVPIADVFPYDYAIASTEQSLRNLAVETIALQQFHVWNPDWIGTDEWRRVIEDLKRSGKVRHFGISINDHDPDSALEIVKSGLIDSVQVIYNIWDQSPERELFPLTAKMDVGVVARVPFDEGSLTGAIHEDTVFEPEDFRAFYFRGDRKKEVVQHVSALQRDLAGAPLPETALRFILTHPAVTTVIPGMRRPHHVASNIDAATKGPLTGDVLETVRRHAWNKNFYC